MAQIWPEGEMATAIDLALKNGNVTVTLESTILAQRFRTALYNFRRRSGLGKNLELIASGCDVILRRVDAHKVIIDGRAAE